MGRWWHFASGFFIACIVLGAASQEIAPLAAPAIALLRKLTLSDVLAYVCMVLGAALIVGIVGRPEIWHLFANRFGVSRPVVIARPWVIDGDTIDDAMTGKRYRLANIDAPETGDNARCFRERESGELAKRMVISAIKAANQVTVRKTFRTDRYGRLVAFVYADGRDLGEWLVAEGLARPWFGRKRRWCGRRGQLQEMAAVRGEVFSCKTCRNF